MIFKGMESASYLWSHYLLWLCIALLPCLTPNPDEYWTHTHTHDLFFFFRKLWVTLVTAGLLLCSTFLFLFSRAPWFCKESECQLPRYGRVSGPPLLHYRSPTLRNAHLFPPFLALSFCCPSLTPPTLHSHKSYAAWLLVCAWHEKPED